MGAAAWLLGGALLARGASTPLPLHGVAARAELVPLLDKEQPVATLPALGSEAFLAFVPASPTAEGILLGSLAPGWAPAATPCGHSMCDEMLGEWRAATPVPPELRGGASPTLVRRDSAAPNEWVPAACVNDRAGYIRNRLWITNGQFKKHFLPRGPQSSERGTKCVDTGRSCGAGVFDGALAPRLLSDVLAVMAPALKSGDAHVRTATACYHDRRCRLTQTVATRPPAPSRGRRRPAPRSRTSWPWRCWRSGSSR